MSPFNKPQRRLYWLDIVIILLMLALIGYVYYRIETVLNYNWDWSFLPQYLVRWDEEQGWVANILLQGLFTTLRLTVWSMLLAGLIGALMGVMRTTKRLLPRLIARTYVELIRNIPPLVFIFIFYFFISGQIMPLLGIEDFVRNASPQTLTALTWLFGPPELLENVLSGIICLALFEGAYVTEIVRAGIQAIPRGQREAGLSIGLSRWSVMRYVVLPQAIQKVIPPLANQFITLIKDSSIVSLISIQELTFLGTEVSVSTSRVFETWIAVAGLYFIICYSLALLFGRLEKRLAVGRR
jgi:polar amino acid transport system permease protein